MTIKFDDKIFYLININWHPEMNITVRNQSMIGIDREKPAKSWLKRMRETIRTELTLVLLMILKRSPMLV